MWPSTFCHLYLFHSDREAKACRYNFYRPQHYFSSSLCREMIWSLLLMTMTRASSKFKNTKTKPKTTSQSKKKNKKMPPLPRPTTIIHQPVPSTDFFKFIFLMYKPNEGINQNTCIPLIRIHAFHASTQMY